MSIADKRKKVLFISAHFPSLASGYAGHKTAYKFLEEYDRSCTVDLVVIANSSEVDEPALHELRNTQLIFVERLTGIRKLCNAISSGALFPLKIQSRFSSSVIVQVKDTIQGYDIIHFEFTHAAALLKNIIKNKSTHTTLVVSSHDLLTQSLLRKSTKSLLYFLINSIDLYKTIAFESYLYRVCDNIIVQSSKDKKLLESLFSVPKGKISVVRPYISPFVTVARQMRQENPPEPRTLLFWGAMNRSENEEAVLIFVKQFGHLLDQLNLTLYVVGNAPSARVQALTSDRIVVTGFIEDPSQFFAKCVLGIVPLISGAGIKVKTLEMLDAGLKVLSTPVGAEGIEHPNLVVSDIQGFKDNLLQIFGTI